MSSSGTPLALRLMKDEKETAIREATDKIEKLHAHEMKMHADAEKLGAAGAFHSQRLSCGCQVLAVGHDERKCGVACDP